MRWEMLWNLKIRHLDTVSLSTRHRKSIFEDVQKTIPSKSSGDETPISTSTSKLPNQDPLTFLSHTPLPTRLNPPSLTLTGSLTKEMVSALLNLECIPFLTCPRDIVRAKSSRHNPVSSSPHPNQPSKSNGPPSKITVLELWASPPISHLSANHPSIYLTVHYPKKQINMKRNGFASIAHVINWTSD